MPKTKWYSNPYQDEVWEAKKQKDKIDNEIAYAMSKICAFFLALGVVYLLLK
jgi:hypothetical protein